MIGKSLFFIQVFFHDLPVMLQMMQLQFCCPRFKRIQFLQDFHPQVEQFFFAFVFRIPCHLDLDQFFLRLLFGIKDAVQLCALVTDPLLVDQGTAMVENFDHLAAARMQIIFHHCICLIKNLGNFLDLRNRILLSEARQAVVQAEVIWRHM